MKKLNKGDTVAIVSLSRGILGEDFVKHEVELGIKRLKEFGLVPKFMDNSLKGIEYLKEHPEKRAEDLKKAFMDKDVKFILTAIGGDDSYRLIPYLMEDKEFIEAVKNNPKIFMGYSDTTINHLLLNKLGLSTYYGPAFLSDFAELDKDMLEYTKKSFEKMFDDDQMVEIKSSPIWYYNRFSYGVEELGKPRISHKEEHGFEVLNGNGIVTGKLYGGCIESFYDIFTGERYGEENIIFEKYNLLPSLDEWKEKILFLETCEETISPDKLKIVLEEFEKRGILNAVKGLIIGKPMDEIYYDEYKKVYKEFFKNKDTLVIYNLNFGHSVPRCILKYDALTKIDTINKKIIMNYK